MDDPLRSLVSEYPATPFFAGVEGEAFARLRDLSSRRHCEAGEVIVAEGADDPYLYIVRRGRVRVEKRASGGGGGGGGAAHALAVLGPGESLGEMKLAAPRPASATVVADGPTDLLCVDLRRLRTEPDPSRLREILLDNTARVLSERLRGTGARAADAMEAELRASRIREAAGRFIVYLVTFMSVFPFFVASLPLLGPRRPSQVVLSSGLIAFGGLIVWAMIRRGPFPLRAYGVTLANGRRVAVEAVIYTLPLLALAALWKALYMRAHPELGLAFFQPLGAVANPTPLAQWMAGLVIYTVLTAAQEFYARGALQTSIRLIDPRGPQEVGGTNWRAILIANTIFGAAHAYIGLWFMLAAFVPGLFWGWLFERQRSLVGVTVSHALLGIWALFLLRLQMVLGGP